MIKNMELDALKKEIEDPSQDSSMDHPFNEAAFQNDHSYILSYNTSETFYVDKPMIVYLGCAECQLTFDNRQSYNYHMEYHKSLSVRHVCMICKKEFKHFNSLSRHNLVHKECEHIKCPGCTKAFLTQAGLMKHIKQKVHCKTCNSLFMDEFSLENHVKLKHTYFCEVCETYFRSWSALNKHKTTHNENTLIKCHACEKVFNRKKNLQIHMQLHEELRCNICNKMFPGACQLEDHKNTQVCIRPYKCAHCNKSFTLKNSLNVHIRVVHLKICMKKHTCAICSSTFHTKRRLKNHIGTHFRTKTPHKCSKCQKLFSSKSNLIRHSAVHSTGKLQCHHCSKVFYSRESLIYHMNIHLKTKLKYKCEFCNTKYKTKTEMNKHIKNMHSNFFS